MICEDRFLNLNAWVNKQKKNLDNQRLVASEFFVACFCWFHVWLVGFKENHSAVDSLDTIFFESIMSF